MALFPGTRTELNPEVGIAASNAATAQTVEQSLTSVFLEISLTVRGNNNGDIDPKESVKVNPPIPSRSRNGESGLLFCINERYNRY